MNTRTESESHKRQATVACKHGLKRFLLILCGVVLGGVVVGFVFLGHLWVLEAFDIASGHGCGFSSLSFFLPVTLIWFLATVLGAVIGGYGAGTGNVRRAFLSGAVWGGLLPGVLAGLLLTREAGLLAGIVALLFAAFAVAAAGAVGALLAKGYGGSERFRRPSETQNPHHEQP